MATLQQLNPSTQPQSTSNIKQHHLLNLPLEIRLSIYRQVFAHYAGWVKIDVHVNSFLIKWELLPLFQVCKQIHLELVPEYYSTTEFHFNAITSLRHAMEHHTMFRRHARYVTFNPHLSICSVDELSVMTNLKSFVISNIILHEPFGSETGKALEEQTLRRVLRIAAGETDDNDDDDDAFTPGNANVKTTMQMHREMLQIPAMNHIHLVIRFRYSFIDQPDKSDNWAARPKKSSKSRSYDCRDDTFTIWQPDHSRSFGFGKNDKKRS